MEKQEKTVTAANTQPTQPQIIVAKSPKSVGIALILTLLFGPLGLLYATVTGGLIMITIGVILGVLTLGMAFIVVWPISIIWSYFAVKKYNEALYSGQV